ncbi:MAG TPA: DUF4105 domain-containing protein [Edaphocola sp.]|nr:DUF4105 domain-containing protein [Edaphocola sp.]
MRYRLLSCILPLLLLCCRQSLALTIATGKTPQQSVKGLRISILTCGVGEELYASFGHTGIRIIDSAKGTDEVYNYGTFDFSDPDFYTKFTLGRLLYYIDKSSFNNFMYEYVEEQRTVQEQVLNLPDSAKQAIQQYLETNLLPQNRGYYYNFIFDNCATRVRDIFPKALGPGFQFGHALKSKNISYRDIINHYLAQKHWERFGINLLLASPVDSAMTNDGSMFLPDFLHDALQNATYNGEKIVSSHQYLLSRSLQEIHPLDGPLWLMVGIFILTVLCYQTAAFRYLRGIVRFLLLFVSGLLGCFMLFMWFGTNHTACADNYNIIWALPPNLVIAFMAHRKTRLLKYYAGTAIVLILIALIVSFLGIQKMPLFELTPFLICLLYVYVDLWKQNPKTDSKGLTA